MTLPFPAESLTALTAAMQAGRDVLSALADAVDDLDAAGLLDAADRALAGRLDPHNSSAVALARGLLACPRWPASVARSRPRNGPASARRRSSHRIPTKEMARAT